MITFTTICASIINFLVLCPLVTKFYLLPYMLCSCDFAQCRCDVDFPGILIVTDKWFYFFSQNSNSSIVFILKNAPTLINAPSHYSWQKGGQMTKNGFRTLNYRYCIFAQIFFSRTSFLEFMNCSAPGAFIRVNMIC